MVWKSPTIGARVGALDSADGDIYQTTSELLDGVALGRVKFREVGGKVEQHCGCHILRCGVAERVLQSRDL